MGLHPQDFSVVPEETARVARAAFPKGNAYMTLRDELGVIYEDYAFAPLFGSPRGRPAESPGCLALVTALQFAENLADRQAADSVRGRIDWKYLLGLELTDPGFDYTLLHEFRNRLLENEAEQKLLDELLKLLKARRLLKARGKQRTDSTHVLAAIRNLNRLELVGETLRHALNSLAVIVPDWLRAQVPPDWFDRYGPPFAEWRLPNSQAKRDALVEMIGQDGFDLWERIGESPQAELLRMVPAVETLRQVWLQQYYVDEGKPRWRKSKNSPPSSQKIVSPYDTEARFSVRRSTKWEGYRVHLTETFDEDQPMLITNVETTHQHLQEKDLLPSEHLVDAGYVDACALAEGESKYGLDLIGPVKPDLQWQAKAGEGYDLSCFVIDWEQQQVTCPQGKTNVGWYHYQDSHGGPLIIAKFLTADCRACPARAQCVRAPKAPRAVTFRPKEQHLALQRARSRQTTEAFKKVYKQRAGVEGTISQGTRVCGLRRSRYTGMAKTHLQHVFTAVAINLIRLAAWFEETPRGQTRCSRFAALALAA
ncbi:MAG: IS1182 family transposase [Anaerolineae bacterium]